MTKSVEKQAGGLKRARVLVGNGSHQAIGHFRMKIHGGNHATFYGVLPVNDIYTSPKIKIYLSFAYPHLYQKAKMTINQGVEYWVRGYPMMNKEGELYEVVVTAWTPIFAISKQFMEYEKFNPYLFWGEDNEPMRERIVITGRMIKNTIEVQESVYQKANLEKYKRTGYLPKRKYLFIEQGTSTKKIIHDFKELSKRFSMIAQEFIELFNKVNNSQMEHISDAMVRTGVNESNMFEMLENPEWVKHIIELASDEIKTKMSVLYTVKDLMVELMPMYENAKEHYVDMTHLCNTFILYRGTTLSTAKNFVLKNATPTACTRYVKTYKKFTPKRRR